MDDGGNRHSSMSAEFPESLGRILWSLKPTQNEKSSRSKEPRTNVLLPFRLCVGDRMGTSALKSPTLPPWWEFLILLHVNPFAFHSLLCHWVYLRFHRIKWSEILIFGGKFLGCFVLFCLGGGLFHPNCKGDLQIVPEASFPVEHWCLPNTRLFKMATFLLYNIPLLIFVIDLLSSI